MTKHDRLFRISGRFDPSAAAILFGDLRAVPADATVVVGFTGATETSIPALGVLAPALTAPDMPRVTVRGLGHHHARLLEYLAGRAPPGLA